MAAGPASFTSRPEILGTFGVVASTHWLASAAGMATLEKGGNAFDAAVATGFALQVVEPHLNGPGGDVPILFYSAREDRVRVVCGQGVAPAAATIDHYRSLGLGMMPGTGHLAAVVPGSFDAWMIMLRDHGTMRLADVLEPAIGYARDGYAMVPRVADAIANVAELFRTEWPTSAAIYLRNGQPPAQFTRFRNPVLADTYRRILREAEAAGGNREVQIEAARRAWYKGFVADAIDRLFRVPLMDTTGERHAGVLTADDMARWEARYEAPLSYDYHGYTVCKTGPWGQGPVFLQQLALLRDVDLAGMAPDGPDFVHWVTEAAKLAFADREAFYGDPDFVKVPMEHLLSDTYNAARRRLIGREASLELRPGTIPGYGGRIDPDAARRGRMGYDTVRQGTRPAGAHQAGVGEPTLQRGAVGEPTIGRDGRMAGDTCHLDVIDRWGNMVSATPSGGWLQSSPVVPELGFSVTTRGQMFWLDADHPAALAPGRRPRTTLTPSFALRDGEPYMAFGTPGGDQQDQWSVVFFLRHVHHGLNLQEAIDAPMFHSESFPSSFYPRGMKPGSMVMEDRFPKATVDELKRRGHIVEDAGSWGLGRLSAATRDGEYLKTAANPRGMQGYAVGR
ncbi:MAG: gamma-glutamyltransferase family protein [Alphaproteobacteria bacterium]|nr:gamma-glutamyltransferase family protein [Alphaproteobacteria bacterium]